MKSSCILGCEVCGNSEQVFPLQKRAVASALLLLQIFIAVKAAGSFVGAKLIFLPQYCLLVFAVVVVVFSCKIKVVLAICAFAAAEV